jgi:hypothetical protein
MVEREGDMDVSMEVLWDLGEMETSVEDNKEKRKRDQGKGVRGRANYETRSRKKIVQCRCNHTCLMLLDKEIAFVVTLCACKITYTIVMSQY